MQSAANRSRKEKGALYPLYFNPSQIKEILSIAGDAGLVLMEHYIAIAYQPDPNMEDIQLAKMLHRTTSAIEKVRLKLTKAGWFKRAKFTKNREAHIMYFVGKRSVQSHSSAYVAFDNTENVNG